VPESWQSLPQAGQPAGRRLLAQAGKAWPANSSEKHKYKETPAHQEHHETKICACKIRRKAESTQSQ
jgi:hypothetical protein